MSADLCRRVAAEHGAVIDKFIEAGALPVPLYSFHNSLFREIEFANKADADWFDFISYTANLNSN
jgi:hypothetical protein